MVSEVRLTHEASIRNYSQVSPALDSHGFAASKLWNVARWTCDRIWSETGTIPEDDVLKAYLKSHERYGDLHSQSSQRVLEELAEAFHGWYAKRRNGDDRANPPKYRKHGDEHPRSTVTWKGNGIRLDAKKIVFAFPKVVTRKSTVRTTFFASTSFHQKSQSQRTNCSKSALCTSTANGGCNSSASTTSAT